MEKIFKKSLALMVSAALCLTAFVGCLTVNAEDTATPTYTITAQNGKAGDTVTVNVDGTNLTSVCGQQVFINIPTALTINSVKNERGVDYKLPNEAEGEAGEYNISTIGDVQQVKFVDIINFPAAGTDGAIETGEFHIVFSLTIPETAAVGATYEIAFDTATMFADIDENAIGITVTPATITVQAAQPACEHVWEVVSATPATADAEGSITFKCSACEETKTETVSYYARYISNSINAAYASAITLEFNSRDDRLTEQGEYSDAFIRFEHNVYGAAEPKITYQSLADSYPTTKSDRACTTWAYELKSMQLTEQINSNVFVEVNGVWYNGDVRGHSVRSYADTIIAGVDESEQILIVNMLRYGSKMQQFKGYNTDNLADANLGDYEALITTTDPTITDSSTKENEDTTGIYITSKFYLDMASRTEAVLYARSDKYTGDNKDNFTIVASWTNAKGGALTRTYYNATYAEDSALVYQNELNTDGSVKQNRYYFSFAELNSYDLRQMVTFYIYDGETEVSQVYTTSIESLVAIGNASGSYGEAEMAVYKAMLNYCDASRAHFCK